ncbi:MAG: hypothetical protein ACRC9L_00650 [Brevinema sp.]
MIRQIGVLKFISIFIIGFFITRMIHKGDMHDIFRFILSLILYSAGFLLIVWALTSGRKKKPLETKNYPNNTDKKSKNKENAKNT